MPNSGALFDALFTFDRVYNLAPSLHITLRTILWAFYIPLLKGVSANALKVWFILVGLSTLLCHQHQVIDLYTGQILGLLALHCFFDFDFKKPSLTTSSKRRKLGLRYLIGSLFFVLLTVLFWLWGVLFIWPATSLLIVSFAYLFYDESFFRKEKGRFPSFTKWLILPYTLGAHLSFLWFTKSSVKWGQAAPDLYFGRRVMDKDLAEFNSLGVKSVVDLTAEYEEHNQLMNVDYKNIAMLDLVVPELEKVKEAVDAIETNIKKGPVYVHCALGFSRSGLVVGAYLLKSGISKTTDEALDKIRQVQPRLTLDKEMVELLRHLKNKVDADID